MIPGTPITEADLHAWVDGQLGAERALEVDAHLARHPDDAQRAAAWRAQKAALRSLYDPVVSEPVPERLSAAVRPRRQRWAERLVAGVALLLIGGGAGWLSRGGTMPGTEAVEPAGASRLAQRAAIAHVVYAPDPRRPVEVDAAHEDQLVAWLSKRMGAPMRAPHLQPLGYTLEGGRLLPGERGPVAQFMYRDTGGDKLTLYVTNEMASGAAGTTPPASADAGTAFRFAREGQVDVFYWIDGAFGYALSAQGGRAELARISADVYRQLAPHR